MRVYLEDALNDVENIGKTIEANAAVPIRYGDTVYDDMQVGISNVKLPTSDMPIWRDYAFGDVVTFPVLGFAIGDIIYFDVQTPHTMKLNTALNCHFHYSTPNNGTGDKFKFQLDVITAPIGGLWDTPEASPYTAEETMAGDYSATHKQFDLADIADRNSSVSTLYKCKLTRIAASGDEYAGEIYISYIDCHYQKDTAGSQEENVK